MRWFSTWRSLSAPGGHEMVSSVAACCVPPTAHALLCIVNGDDSAVFRFFVPGDLDLWPLTLTFEFGRDFCTTYLTAKFDRPTFSRSDVIVRTNRETDKLANRRRWKHPPRSAMLRRWVIITVSHAVSSQSYP